jgi:CheY-like chemotaxis protein
MAEPVKPPTPVVALERIVLILEDEPMLRTSMARGLRRIPGLEVLEAGTLAEARQLAVAARPHLVVSDLDLPDGTGIELLTDLARAGLRIPVVFVSAYVGEYSDQLPQFGGIEVHEKPLSLADLRSTVLDRLGPVVQNEAPFHVTDYIQLACMGGRSVLLSLQSGGRLVGEIIISSGHLWSARDGKGEGEEAFRRLVFRAGLAVVVRAIGDAGVYPRNLEGSGQHVLLEAARLQDEGVALEATSPEEDCFLDDDGAEVFAAPVGDRPPPKRSGRYRIDTPADELSAAVRRRPQITPRPGSFTSATAPTPASGVSARRMGATGAGEGGGSAAGSDGAGADASSAAARVSRPSPSQPHEMRFTPPTIRETGSAPEDRVDADLDRAVELMLKKRYDEARAVFLHIEAMQPDHPRVRANLDRLRKLGY